MLGNISSRGGPQFSVATMNWNWSFIIRTANFAVGNKISVCKMSSLFLCLEKEIG